MFLNIPAVTCPAKSTGLRSAWATRRKRAKRMIFVRSFSLLHSQIFKTVLYKEWRMLFSCSVHVLPTVSATKGSDDWRVVFPDFPRASEERGAKLTAPESALLCGEDHVRGGVQWVKRGWEPTWVDVQTRSTFTYNSVTGQLAGNCPRNYNMSRFSSIIRTLVWPLLIKVQLFLLTKIKIAMFWQKFNEGFSPTLSVI